MMMSFGSKWPRLHPTRLSPSPPCASTPPRPRYPASRPSRPLPLPLPTRHPTASNASNALASAAASPHTSHIVASRGAPVDAAAAMTIARELEAAHPTRNRPSAHAVPQASVAAAQSSHSDQTLLSVLASLLGHLPASAAAVQPSLPRPQQRPAAPHGSAPDPGRLHDGWAPHLFRVPQAWPRPPRLPAAAPTRPGFSVVGAATTGSLARLAVVTSVCQDVDRSVRSPFSGFSVFRSAHW